MSKAKIPPQGYTQADLDEVADNPELTVEQIRGARPLEEALPGLAEVLKRRGRPKAENPKVAVKLRLDPDVLDAFKATGPGWQTRMNDALRSVAPRVARSKSQTRADKKKSASGGAR